MLSSALVTLSHSCIWLQFQQAATFSSVQGDQVGFMFDAQSFHSFESPDLAPIAYRFDVFTTHRIALLYEDRERAFDVGSTADFALIDSPIAFELEADVAEGVMCVARRKKRRK